MLKKNRPLEHPRSRAHTAASDEIAIIAPAPISAESGTDGGESKLLAITDAYVRAENEIAEWHNRL
jgi:hypothetical protein